MAGKPETKPPTKLGKELVNDISDRTAPSEGARTIAIPQAAGEKPKAEGKAEKPKAKTGKLQLVIPLLVLWKLRIAAAQEGTTVGKLLLKWIAAPLREYTYPPLPLWLKKKGASEDEVNAAA